MKLLNSHLLKSILVITCAFLTTTQTSYAQTALEFSSKTDQEKTKTIDALLQRAYSRLASPDLDGVKKSQEVLIGHRRISNLLRALFKEETDKSSNATESDGVTNFKRLMIRAAKEVPEKDVWDIFRIYVNSEYEEYYEKSNGEWKKDFDSKTDAEQQSQFRLEIVGKRLNKVLSGLKSEEESLRAKARNSKLFVASYDGDVAAVRALLAEGADINFKDKEGNTALMAASSQGHLPVVQILLAKGADVNAKTNSGDTALTLASEDGQLKVVQILLSKKVDINAKDIDGVTALMKAAMNGHFLVVQELVTRGADVCSRANKGFYALTLAKVKNHTTIVRFLEEKMNQKRCP